MVRESFAAASPGSRLHVIPDGDEALRFLRRAGEYAAAPRPALILLDLNLPGMGGLDILARVKADPALAIIPVIVLSGSRDSPKSPAPTPGTPTPTSPSRVTSTATTP
jgi:CheY-like chemotaxis protein